MAVAGRSASGTAAVLVTAASALAIGTGTVAIAGWLLHVPPLTTLLPGRPAMVPLTAAGLVVVGAALGLVGLARVGRADRVRRLTGRAAAVVVAAVGGMVLVEYVTGADLRLDRLLDAGVVTVSATGGQYPGRPSPHAAAAFLTSGLALALLDTRTRGGRRPGAVLAPVVALISLTALVGSVYGVGYLRGETAVTGMGVPTAVALLALAVGILAAREDRWPVRTLTSSGPGGALARRLTPVIFGVPFVVGLAAAVIGRAARDTALAVTLTTAATFLGLTVVVLINARRLDSADAGRQLLLRELHRQRDFDASLLATMHDGLMVLDATPRIVDANPQLQAILGVPLGELIGQAAPWPWWPEGDASRLAETLAACADDQIRESEIVILRPDGTERTLLAYFAPLPRPDGGPGLYMSTLVDITDRVEAQAERDRLLAEAERERLQGRLHQAQRLESLGQLAGGVAHDFNNLLGVILNYAGFVENDLANAAAAATPGDGRASRWDDVRADVGQIRRAAERATALTHQLLAFGRREVIRPRVVDVNDIVSDLDPLLRRTLGEHIRLCIEPTPEVHPVLADPGQIEQVLVNLAVNARDAMPAGGTLTIDTANLTVDEEFAAGHVGVHIGPHVRLRVGDTGTGIPQDVLSRVFEPFFTTKPKGQGTGLGLATVYGIITQAGGYTYIQSAPGAGTTVTVLLPVTDKPLEQPQQSPATTTTQPGIGGRTILLVEDEDALREVTRRILARNGYQVLTAPGGSEALALADRTEDTIDLLITDVIMPNMLGKDVAARIRSARPGTRVLYISGYAYPVLASQGTLEPGVTLLSKPFTEATLLEKIDEVLTAPAKMLTF